MSKQLFADIRKRVEAATEGPWNPRVDSKEGWSAETGTSKRHATYLYPTGVLHIHQGQDLCRPAICHPQACLDAKFIAASRTDIPRLLEALDIAHEALDKMRDQVMLPHQITHDELECACNVAVTIRNEALNRIASLEVSDE